jgi:phosphoserine phosphatase
MNSKKRLTVLAVDLDHTLIDIDMIHYGLKQILVKKPYLYPILFFTFLFKGKTYAKKYLYENSTFEIKNIPFNNTLIEYINEHKDNYDHIILISGSYYKYVQYIADHLKIFDSVAGTNNKLNMISINKVIYLNKKFDNPIFDYIGDSRKDIPIWGLSRNALVVDHGKITKHISHLNYKIVSKRS